MADRRTPPKDRDPLAGLIGRLDGPSAPSAAFADGLRARLLAELGGADAAMGKEAAMRGGAGVLDTTGAAPAAAAGRTAPAGRRFGPLRSALDAVAAAVLAVLVLGSATVAWRLGRDAGEPPAVPSAGLATPAPEAIDGATMEFGNAARTGEVSGAGPVEAPTLRWRAPTAAGFVGSLGSPVAVADGIAYFVGVVNDPEREMEGEDALVAVDVVTRAVLWSIVESGLGFEDLSTPAVAEGTVFVGITTYDNARFTPDDPYYRPDDALVALDARTGRERWRVPDAGSGSSAPAVVDGTVYAGGENGVVVATDASTGSVRWYSDPWPTRGDRGVSMPAVGAGIVFVVDGSGTLRALDAATGDERWRNRPEAPGDRTERWGPAVVAGGTVYLAVNRHPEPGEDFDVTGRLLALDAATGTEQWHHDQESWVVPPVVGAEGVYLEVGGDESTIVALDPRTGAPRWARDVDGRIDGSAVLASGILYVLRADSGLLNLDLPLLGASRRLLALDVASGDRLWEVDASSEAVGTPAVAGGMAYVGEGGIELDGGGTLRVFGDR